jgi:hypothetical protein
VLRRTFLLPFLYKAKLATRTGTWKSNPNPPHQSASCCPLAKTERNEGPKPRIPIHRPASPVGCLIRCYCLSLATRGRERERTLAFFPSPKVDRQHEHRWSLAPGTCSERLPSVCPAPPDHPALGPRLSQAVSQLERSCIRPRGKMTVLCTQLHPTQNTAHTLTDTQQACETGIAASRHAGGTRQEPHRTLVHPVDSINPPNTLHHISRDKQRHSLAGASII